MTAHHTPFKATVAQKGFSLLEVLVSIVILAIGLLGLAGLQTKANEVEIEAYQRSVALMLVQDMADRISAGRQYVEAFKAKSLVVYGGDGQLDACPDTADVDAQLCEWGNAMDGAGEKKGAANIGAPIGMRGCLISIPPTNGALGEFFVVGVWQGLLSTASPPANTPGAQCDPNADFGAANRRRAIVTRVLIPKQEGTF